MSMLRIIYHSVVLYLSLHLLWNLLREKKPLIQAGTALVLVLFVLRLILLK